LLTDGENERMGKKKTGLNPVSIYVGKGEIYATLPAGEKKKKRTYLKGYGPLRKFVKGGREPLIIT